MNYSRFFFLNALRFTPIYLLVLTVSAGFGQNLEAAACASPTFLAGRAVSVNGTAGMIASGDFNNDGRRDVAVSAFNGFGTSRVEVKLGDGNGDFTTAGSVSTPDYITALTVADFNADGNLDLLAAHRWGSSAENGVSLLTGDGAGHFIKARTLASAPKGEPSAIAAGDFNGDDRADFAVADAALGTATIYYGDNAGEFPSNSIFTTGFAPNSIAKADFNGDSKSDLIIANTNSPFVTMLLGNPNGGFNPPVSVSIAANTNANFIAAGDINGDGKADAVAASIGTGFSGASVLIGNGAGGFALKSFLASDAGTNKIFLFDINKDGKLDILSTAGQNDGGSGKSAVRLGNGDGTFGGELAYASAGFVISQTLGDFDGDGKIDSAQTAGSMAEFQLFFGAGDGRFGAPTVSVGGQPISTAAADFNGDGKPDLAVGNFDLWNVSIMTGDGRGNLTVTKTIPLSQRPSAIFSADFNGDGKPDLGTLNWYTQTGAGGYTIILNSGNGFAEPVTYYSGSNAYRFLLSYAVADVTGDGVLDIVIGAGDSPGLLSIQKGNGDGTFTILQAIYVGQGGNAYSPGGVAVGDFNRDGKNDIAVAAAGNVLVYLGNGAGSFGSPTFFPVANKPVARIVTADFNHDGILDVAVTNNDQNAASYTYVPSLSVLLGNGAGAFSAAKTYDTGSGTSSVAIADFNNDTHPDIAVANGLRSAYPDNRVGILYGDGKGAFSAAQRFVSGLNPFDLSVADFNTDGKPDIATPNFRGEDVSILLNNCPAAAPTGFPTLSIGQDVTLTETDAGTTNAVFTVTLSASSLRPVLVDYYTAAGTAAGFFDYQPVAGTLRFEPNEISKLITISVKGDTTDESDEKFNVFLVNPVNASLANGKAIVNITEDADAPPTVSIGDATFKEGDNGNVTAAFSVTLSEPSGKPISVGFATAPGTATAGVDFVSASGTLNIPAGGKSATINITINGDTLVEPDETFFITLGNPVNVSISRASAVGTIVNDDAGGNVQFGSGGAFNVAENAGFATITITRANGAASGVVVSYATSSGSAVAGLDYSPVSGSVTFAANETSRTFTVPVINDSLDEESVESVNLSLTGVTGGATLGIPSTGVLNIADDDAAPKIRIGNASLNEGNQGLTTATLTVSLSAASGRIVDVGFATVDETATAPDDYRTASGVLSFAPGETVKTIAVQIVGDTSAEADEIFQVSLSNPVNSILDNSIGTVTIVNDDLRKNSFFDYDGDKRADVSVYRPSNGMWYLHNSTTGFAAVQFGSSTDRMVPADYDGDGRTDIAVWRENPSNPDRANFYILNSSTGTVRVEQFGRTGDSPTAVADFDGDGRADPAVYRAGTNGGQSFFFYKPSTQPSIDFVSAAWGISEDKPVVADYDGDGKTDVAVFRPSNGIWYIARSGGGFSFVQFGATADKPVTGDYDGDGRADQAVYRPANGTWYINQSSKGFTAAQFGISTDLPVAADYDGDGRTDIAVYRSAGGNWYINQSTLGFSAIQFGSSNDKPTPNALVP